MSSRDLGTMPGAMPRSAYVTNTVVASSSPKRRARSFRSSASNLHALLITSGCFPVTCWPCFLRFWQRCRLRTKAGRISIDMVSSTETTGRGQSLFASVESTSKPFALVFWARSIHPQRQILQIAFVTFIGLGWIRSVVRQQMAKHNCSFGNTTPAVLSTWKTVISPIH